MSYNWEELDTNTVRSWECPAAMDVLLADGTYLIYKTGDRFFIHSTVIPTSEQPNKFKEFMQGLCEKARNLIDYVEDRLND